MKEMGAIRPSCEDCGKIELTEQSNFVWYLANFYFKMLVRGDGFNWYVDAAALQMLADEYEIDSVIELADRILIVFNNMLAKEKNKEESPNA